MTIEQIIVLAVVQGITEFLPISSSGHLILIPQLMHWPDQGILVDVMTHFGTLLAILIYFWRDVWKLILGGLALLKGKLTDDGKLAIYIVLATIPAVVFGFVLKKFGYADLERNVAIVAWNTILYGILMLIADMVGPQERTIQNMTLGSALIIGTAQALALIPGTSRSGVTMTAGRFLGFTRPDCARFSSRRRPSSPAFSPSPSSLICSKASSSCPSFSIAWCWATSCWSCSTAEGSRLRTVDRELPARAELLEIVGHHRRDRHRLDTE